MHFDDCTLTSNQGTNTLKWDISMRPCLNWIASFSLRFTKGGRYQSKMEQKLTSSRLFVKYIHSQIHLTIENLIHQLIGNKFNNLNN